MEVREDRTGQTCRLEKDHCVVLGRAGLQLAAGRRVGHHIRLNVA